MTNIFSRIKTSIVLLALLTVLFTPFAAPAHAQVSGYFGDRSEMLLRVELLQQILQLQQMLQELLAERNVSSNRFGSTQSTDANSEVVNADEQRVEATERLRVRANATALSSVVGIVPAGMQGDVLDGPRNSGLFQWWQIAYDNGLTGWSAGNWLEFSGSDLHDEDEDSVEVSVDDSSADDSQSSNNTNTDSNSPNYIGSVVIREAGANFSRNIGSEFTLETAREYCDDYAESKPNTSFSCQLDQENVPSAPSFIFIGNYGSNTSGENTGNTGSYDDDDWSSGGTSDDGSTEQLGEYRVTLPGDNGGTIQIHYDASVSESEAESHCQNNLASWTSRYEDNYPGKVITCRWESPQGSSWQDQELIQGNDNNGLSQTQYQTPEWNSKDKTSFVCSECAEAFCAYQGHGEVLSFTTDNRAGEEVYGCWDPDNPNSCAPCWESPWNQGEPDDYDDDYNGCNILQTVTCQI